MDWYWHLASHLDLFYQPGPTFETTLDLCFPTFVVLEIHCLMISLLFILWANLIGKTPRALKFSGAEKFLLTCGASAQRWHCNIWRTVSYRCFIERVLANFRSVISDQIHSISLKSTLQTRSAWVDRWAWQVKEGGKESGDRADGLM